MQPQPAHLTSTRTSGDTKTTAWLSRTDDGTRTLTITHDGVLIAHYVGGTIDQLHEIADHHMIPALRRYATA